MTRLNALEPTAALTLQIVAFLQSEPDAPRFSFQWMFVPPPVRWPGGHGYTYSEAAAFLAAIDKPVVVGALNHPGYVALWRPTALDEAEREYVKHELANQQAGFSTDLANLGAADADSVLFEGWGVKVNMPASVMRQWLAEYALTWAWTLARPTDDTHGARLVVWHSGHRWSPGFHSSGPGLV